MRLAALIVGFALMTSASAEPRRIITAAVATLGGSERLLALDDWIVEGSGRENLSAELQGVAHDEPTWRPHEERVAVQRAAGAVAWERKTPRNDGSLRWRRFIYKPDAFGVVDFVTGSGAMRDGGRPEAARLALMRRIPHLLLLEVATRATSFASRGKDVVEATLPDAGVLTLRFSRSPALLTRVEYATHLPGIGDTRVAWTWSKWKKHAVLGYAPSAHRIEVGNSIYQEVRYSRFAARASDAAALMTIPPLQRRISADEPPPAAGPATGEVAPGVHIAELRGFQVMFVELATSVVVFDTPAPAAGLESIPASNAAMRPVVVEELLALIAKTSPSKPIRHVIISHHHGDHIGGLATLAAAIDGPLTVYLPPGDVALAPPNVIVHPVASRHKIGGRVEVINVGPNPHTRENLFAWLPAEKIVLDGDLFYFDEGHPFPPSGREVMNRFFARWLHARGLEPERIYGVHYRGAAGREALRRAAGS